MERIEMFAALFEPANGWLDDETMRREFAAFEASLKGGAKLETPVVHLNGTSKQGLLDQLREATRAINTAREKLHLAAPHGRDYYVRDDDAYRRAAVQHRSRDERLGSVYDELMEIVRAVRDQGR